MSNEKQPLKTQPVKVIKAGHQHNGKPCEIGDTIHVTDGQKAFLEKKQIIEADKAPPAKSDKRAAAD